MPEDSEADIDDETQAILTSDFELGHYIRERIVPRAVLYYTGNFHNYIIFIIIFRWNEYREYMWCIYKFHAEQLETRAI